MENALFYTFSTIAQTLGGAIALLGAFVLYRLQSISNELEDAGISAMQPYLPQHSEPLQKLLVEGKYRELYNYLQQITPQVPPTDQPQAAIRYAAAHLEKLSSLVRRRFSGR